MGSEMSAPKTQRLHRDQIVQRLRRHEKILREQFGVRSLALFGSAARNEAGGESDIDLLVEFDRPVGFFEFFDLQDFVSELLGGADVDLAVRGAIVDELKEIIYGEAIDVIK